MPHIQIPSQIFTVTAVSYSVLTLAPNAGYTLTNLYAGLVGNLRLGADATSVVIVEVLSIGVVRVGIPAGSGYNTAVSFINLAAYGGGTLYFETQLADVSNSNSELTPNQLDIVQGIATSFSNFTDLDTGAAPTAGLVYRSTGTANAVTEAQADSAVNAAGIIGVGDSVIGLRPLTVPGAIAFDSLPVVGQIAYLSATVAGQATCTVPAVGEVDKQFGHVDRIISGVAPFSAWVTPIGTSGDGYSPPEALVYYEANSATPATDMQVKIVTGWIRTIPGKVVSFQFVWDGNVTGEFTLEGTNDSAPATGLDGNNDVYPAAGYAEPSQPAGVAGSTTIAAIASHAWHRGVFDPSADGAGVTPSGNVAKG